MNTSINKMMTSVKSMNVNSKAVLITLGAVGGVTALGITAATVWNSRQMRTARAVKRTGKILYQVGTAMRNVSGMNGEA